jgi:hypothetical protein
MRFILSQERNMPGQVTTTTLNIPEPAIADLRERLARTRLPDQAPGPAWAYGTDLEYMRQLLEYWQTDFDWRAQEARLMRDNASTDPADPAINRVLATAAQHSLPVNVACTGRLDQAGQLAARNPNTRMVIDHLGLPQPHQPPRPAEPFADLPKLLALAARDNVAVKISGACTLSHEPFPYEDIWNLIFRVFDAFGFDRCMWGTARLLYSIVLRSAGFSRDFDVAQLQVSRCRERRQ